MAWLQKKLTHRIICTASIYVVHRIHGGTLPAQFQAQADELPSDPKQEKLHKFLQSWRRWSKALWSINKVKQVKKTQAAQAGASAGSRTLRPCTRLGVCADMCEASDSWDCFMILCWLCDPWRTTQLLIFPWLSWHHSMICCLWIFPV